MDSGPNHLNGISLNSRYAGICGFDVDEFPILFADRLEPTLRKPKDAGEISPSADLGALLDKI